MIVNSMYVGLPIKDIDTDMIIPAQYLTSISREGFGQNLFRRLRDIDAKFPLNDPSKRDAKVLIADSNFGCGSSREHAVWALQGWGFQTVIAKSFADIFAGNAAKNNLMLITLPSEVVDKLMSDQDGEINIDLAAQTVLLPWKEIVSFEYDQFRKYCLIEQKDDLGYLLEKKDIIEKYWANKEQQRFFRTNQ